MPKISVIVPVYNGAHTLAECLDSIEACGDKDFEILVVDDFSTDNSPEIALRFPHVRLVRLKERHGAGGARVAGVAQSTGDIIAFTDSDCIVPSNWLAHVRRLLTNDLGGVGGQYRVDSRQNFMGRFATYDLCNFWFHWLPEFPDHLATGNCAYWKYVLKQVDHQQAVDVFKGMAAAEDTLLGLFVYRQYKLRYAPELYVIHQSPSRFGVWFRQQRVRGFSRIIVSRLHFRSKVLKTRDISMVHIFLQLLLTCAIIMGVGIMPLHLAAGLLTTGITVFFFLALQQNALRNIYAEEKKWSSVLFSIPMIFFRNIAWWLGCIKGILYLLLHPTPGSK